MKTISPDSNHYVDSPPGKLESLLPYDTYRELVALYQLAQRSDSSFKPAIYAELYSILCELSSNDTALMNTILANLHSQPWEESPQEDDSQNPQHMHKKYIEPLASREANESLLKEKYLQQASVDLHASFPSRLVAQTIAENWPSIYE